MTNPLAKELLEAAAAASERAYCPFSRYSVGAALRTPGGSTYSGCNVENASYGLTNCAERSAVFAAVAQGDREFSHIAIVADGDQVPYPCGACRQVLAEFCGPDLQVYIASRSRLDAFESLTLGELLPKTFSLEEPTDADG